jgi:hypothetical protein
VEQEKYVVGTRREMHTTAASLENPKGRDHLGSLVKQVNMCTETRHGQIAVFYGHGDEPSGPIIAE